MKYVILFFIFFFSMGCQNSNLKTIVTNKNQRFTVNIANTPELQTKGLMNVRSLPKNHGMLFVFDKEDLHGFWMKNTFIPLDIIWLDQHKKIVDIQTVQPCLTEPCPSFFPKQKALYVLEVNAYTFNGSIGDTAHW